jgi:hypothetical protein
MRQGQQKRMRGRSRGGKGPNPLSRSYESNGPDVKVRGTAAHIAEKYVQLARDAQSSGDPILAEAYLQHAEHYFRIIAAAQPQFGSEQGFSQGAEDEEEGDDSEFDGPIPSMPQGFGSPANQFGNTQGLDEQPRLVQPARERNYGDRERSYNDRGEGGQPYREREPRFRDRNDRFNGERTARDDRPLRDDRPPRDDRPYREDRQPREDRPYREDRQPRERNYAERGEPRSFDAPPNGFTPEGEAGGEPRSFTPRPGRRERRFGDRPERPFRERNSEGAPPFAERPQGERAPYQERSFQPAPVVPVDQPQPDVSDDNSLSTLPSFITGAPAVAPAPAVTAAPVAAAPVAPVAVAPVPVEAAAVPVEGEGEARFPLRTRRKRVTKRAAEASETPEPSAEPAGE